MTSKGKIMTDQKINQKELDRLHVQWNEILSDGDAATDEQARRNFWTQLSPACRAQLQVHISKCKKNDHQKKREKRKELQRRLLLERKHSKPKAVIIVPKKEPVSLGWTHEYYAFDHVIPFCSHVKRSDAEKKEDGKMGINRCVFSNLFVDDEPLVIQESSPLLGHGAEYDRALCAESYYMAAKCRFKYDAQFVMNQTNSFRVAQYGHNGLRLTDEERNGLIQCGADPEDFLAVLAKEKNNGENMKLWLRGKDGKLPVREGWTEFRHDVFLYILRHKFSFSNKGSMTKRTLQCLVNTIQNGDCLLMLPVEHRPADGFWGDAGDGSGFNVLGKTIAQVVLEEAGLTTSKVAYGQATSGLFQPFGNIVHYTIMQVAEVD